MTPEKYRNAGELFDKLVGLPENVQRDYLETACASDLELRRHVADLLKAERETPEFFLEQPAIHVAANLITNLSQTDALPGTQLGAYVLGRQIGAGGMGAVYTAQDVRLNRKVALKILPALFVDDPDRIRRLRQEAQAISMLNHPNIVSIYDAELASERSYIATEFVEGKTLRSVGAEGPMDLKLLIDIAIQICSALAAAHQAGIVHRDIKPENVMQRPDGIVKVLDFGLAKLFDPVSGENKLPLDTPETATVLHTRPGSIAGTVQYLSPEQIMGKLATPRSDIFALGVMLYELSTGVRPFAGPTEGAVLSAILNHTPPIPSSLRPALTPDWDALVMRALERDPELRFQTAADLRSSCRLLLRATESPKQTVPSAQTASRRHRIGLWAAVAAITAGVGAAGLWLGSAWHREPNRVPKQFTRLTERPGEENFPNLSPDGSQFFYSNAARGKWDIYLQRTGGSAPINLTADSPNDDTEPSLSRDGTRICFRSQRDGGGLYVMEATGENPTRIAPHGHLPCWSPDSKSIVYSDDTFTLPSERGPPTSRLHVINLASGRERELGTGDAVQPNWSPHGYRVAYWAVSQSGSTRDIWTVAADGTAPLAVTNDAALDWNPVWSPDGTELYFISDRGGLMNLWRVRIDERTGHTLGSPEPVTVPAPYIKFLSFSANGQKFIYSQAQRRVNLYSVAFDKTAQKTIGEPVPVGSSAINMTNFSFSPDGTQLVYDNVGDPQEDLWISNLDGSGRRRLTTGGRNRAPQWSPDGAEILFFSDRSGFYNDYSIHPDGSALRQLTAATSPHNIQVATWIDGGKRILGSDMGSGPFIMDRNPAAPVTDPQPLPAFKPSAGSKNHLSLFISPPENGILIGFLSEFGDIVRYSLATGKLDLVGGSGRPAWVPGSHNRLFVHVLHGVCYLRDLDTNRQKQLFSVAPNGLYSLAFEPSGQRLYFTERIQDADLWMAQF